MALRQSGFNYSPNGKIPSGIANGIQSPSARPITPTLPTTPTEGTQRPANGQTAPAPPTQQETGPLKQIRTQTQTDEPGEGNMLFMALVVIFVLGVIS